MRLCSLASGSSGNCLFIGTDRSGILIDAGISCRRIIAGLDSIGIGPHQISAILITHEHSDHVRGLSVLSKKLRVPIYTSAQTYNAILKSGAPGFDDSLFNQATSDTAFTINGLDINPFQTPHDASEPLCYTISSGNKKISVATDLGCYDRYIVDRLAGSDMVFIEANHDIDMLKNGSYPYFLKKRILGERGHLSNDMAGNLIADIYSDRLKYALLGHLSRENNHPELAYRTVGSKLVSAGIKPGADIKLKVAARESLTPVIEI